MTIHFAGVTAKANIPVRARSLLVTPLLFLALAAPVHAEPPLFSAPFLSFDAGPSPVSVAIADLNADGRPDMVTGNIGYDGPDNTISVLLGSGDGTFGAKTNYDTGSGFSSQRYLPVIPLSVAIGDLNGDGRLDLAVASPLSNWVSVLLGHGDGTFGPRIDLSAGSYPTSVAIADLNMDGRLDLTVANFYSRTVSVLLGNGDGTFVHMTDFDTGTSSYLVAIADLNADGRPDLATANYFSSTVTVQLGNGDGTFGPKTEFASGSGPVSMAIADLNADGHLDLAVANGDTGRDPHDPTPPFPITVSVLLGYGDGTFAPNTDYNPGGGFSVAIADLNADGRPDLALGGSGVWVLQGNGDGTFGPGTNFVAQGGRGVAIADLNADGRLDVAAAGGSNVSVLLGNGDGTFGHGTAFGTGNIPTSVAIADLNADGRPDLAVANWGYGNGNTVSVLLGNGDGMFGPKTDFGAGGGPMSVAIADVNADGRPDLATANWNYTLGNNTVSVLLGNGDGTFGSSTDFGIGSGPSSLAIADLNADGRLDLAATNAYSNTVSVLLGNGDGTFGAKTDFGTGSFPTSVAIADLNADGRPDLVTANHGTDGTGNTVSVLLGKSNGFRPKTDFITGTGAQAVAIADLNADARPDLAVANSSAGCALCSPPLDPGNTVSVLLGNGNGTFVPKTDFGTGAQPQSVAIGDLNADGRPDMAVANISGNTVSVLLGSGVGTFGPRIDFGSGTFPTSVAIADLNADGRPDLAVTNRGSNTVSVLLHTADGLVATPVTEFVGESALNLVAPNPARTASQIQYTVARAGHVRLEVTDVAGRVVTTLFDGIESPGRFHVAWDGTNRGDRLPAGLYFIRLTTLDGRVAKKLTRLR